MALCDGHISHINLQDRESNIESLQAQVIMIPDMSDGSDEYVVLKEDESQ